MNDTQLEKIQRARGFIAALDQSGGSTPKALREYGVGEDNYSSEAEMFDLVHAMRSRIITSGSFDGDRTIGAILFEQTMDRSIDGIGTAEFLWTRKNVVPFLKVDKGLAEQINGVQLMKSMNGLDELLARAKTHPIFGTKMRSVIHKLIQRGSRRFLINNSAMHAPFSLPGSCPSLSQKLTSAAPRRRRPRYCSKKA